MNFTYWDSQQNEENNEKKVQIKQLKKKRLKINIQTCWDSNPDFCNASAVLSNQWSYIYNKPTKPVH